MPQEFFKDCSTVVRLVVVVVYSHALPLPLHCYAYRQHHEQKQPIRSTLLFIYLLFKSHKAISVTDNAKKLMESILRTRKVIKYYVIYNLAMAFISLVVGFCFAITQNPELSDSISHFNNQQLFISLAILIVFIIVFIIVLWLFYKLLYGLLLKRLNQNYKELKKLEIQSKNLSTSKKSPDFIAPK